MLTNEVLLFENDVILMPLNVNCLFDFFFLCWIIIIINLAFVHSSHLVHSSIDNVSCVHLRHVMLLTIMKLLLDLFFWFKFMSYFLLSSFQELASRRWVLFGLLFWHETAVDANHIRCYNRRRWIYHTQYTVSKSHIRKLFEFYWLDFEFRNNFFFFCRFVQSWSVKNNGDESWPYGCYIKSTSNDNLSITPVSSIEPGDCTVISVKLMSPPELGSFQTKWRLFTSNGSCFGGMWRNNQ